MTDLDRNEQLAEFLKLLDALDAAAEAHATAYEGPEKRAAGDVWGNARAEIVAWAEEALLPSKPVEISDKTGGQAFPNTWTTEAPTPGMTLRDYFAAQALSALITGLGAHRFWEDPMTGVAQRAYELADAMMEARK